MDKTITVIAKLKAKEGKEEDLRQALLSLVEHTKKKEEGWINYDLHISDHEKGFFMFHENWENTMALSKHMSTPFFRDTLEAIEDMLSEPMDVTLWEKIA